jgi:hypothetical protein
MSTERLGRPVQESRADASSSSSGDDVVDLVNLKEDDLWKKSKHCSGCQPKDASWVLELADALGRQRTQLFQALLCGLYFMEFGSGTRRRLGSDFDDSDERITEGFEEDELLCNFYFLSDPVCKQVDVIH